MYEVSKCAPQEALRNLDRAYDHFFRRVRLKRAGQGTGPIGFPKFKSKKHGPGSFRLTGSIKVFNSAIQLPRLGKQLDQAGDGENAGTRSTTSSYASSASAPGAGSCRCRWKWKSPTCFRPISPPPAWTWE